MTEKMLVTETGAFDRITVRRKRSSERGPGWRIEVYDAETAKYRRLPVTRDELIALHDCIYAEVMM